MVFAEAVTHDTIDFFLETATNYGIPKYFVSNRNAYLKSKEVVNVCEKLEIT